MEFRFQAECLECAIIRLKAELQTFFICRREVKHERS